MSSPRSLAGLVLLAAFGCSIFVTADIDINQLNVNDLQNKLPAEFANANVSMDDVRKLFRDKCIENAGDTNGTAAFTAIENGMTEFMLCFNDIVNFTAIQAEIAEASPHGELDVVFHKYCNKRPAAMECVETLNSKFVPCLDKEERENQDVFMRIVNSLLNFVCHKGGDQIALFIAEQGPECLQSQQDEIQQCFNETFAGYVPKDGLESVKKIPKLVVDQKTCENMAKLETCIMNKLERCSEITPANIVESMFRFIKNETMCRNEKGRNYQQHMAHEAGAAGALRASLLGLILSLMLLVSGGWAKYFN